MKSCAGKGESWKKSGYRGGRKQGGIWVNRRQGQDGGLKAGKIGLKVRRGQGAKNSIMGNILREKRPLKKMQKETGEKKLDRPGISNCEETPYSHRDRKEEK